jgi:hypothetical protein
MILIKWSTNPTVVEPGEPQKTVAKITRLLAARSNVRPDAGWTITLTYAAALTVLDRRALDRPDRLNGFRPCQSQGLPKPLCLGSCPQSWLAVRGFAMTNDVALRWMRAR